MIRPNILPLQHVPNARDLGGYVGFDGQLAGSAHEPMHGGWHTFSS